MNPRYGAIFPTSPIQRPKGIRAAMTDDPETRTVLLHASEMLAALNEITSVEPGSSAHRHADSKCCELMRKIEADISAARKP